VVSFVHLRAELRRFCAADLVLLGQFGSQLLPCLIHRLPHHIAPPNHGCLIPWARRGVLLLNTVLTVRAHAAASHQGHGWEQFTDHIIRLLGARERPLAFILWGSPARRKRTLITNPAHFIVESPHPSPLSAHRGFFGSRPFSRVNDFLVRAGETPIEWALPPAEEINV
ncbi:MAG: uracil-DNA glycosylase, partial [Selenomonas artemidis]